VTDLRASLTMRMVDEVSAKARQIEQSVSRLGVSAETAGSVGTAAMRQLDAATEEVADSSRRAARASSQAAAVASRTSAAVSSSAQASNRAAQAGVAHAQSMVQTGTAARSARRGLLNVDRAARLQGRQMAENINLVSELALGFGSLSPATQALGLSFATAGNNAFALANALGPIGVVAGTLFGVIPGLIALFRNLGDEAEGAADRATESFATLQQQVVSAQQEQEEERSLFEGAASLQDTEGALTVRRNELAARQQQIEETIAEAGSSRAQRLASQAIATDNFDFSQASVEALIRQQLIDEGEDPTRNPEGFARAIVGRRQQVQPLLEQLAPLVQRSEGGAGEIGTVALQNQIDRLQSVALPAARETDRQAQAEDAAQQSRENADVVGRLLEAEIAQAFGPDGGAEASALSSALRQGGAIDGRAREALGRLSTSQRETILERAQQFRTSSRIADLDELESERTIAERAIARADRATPEEQAGPITIAKARTRRSAGNRGGPETQIVEANRSDPFEGSAARIEQGAQNLVDGLEQFFRSPPQTQVEVRVLGGTAEVTQDGVALEPDFDSLGVD
jgi:hypothetical protein